MVSPCPPRSGGKSSRSHPFDCSGATTLPVRKVQKNRGRGGGRERGNAILPGLVRCRASRRPIGEEYCRKWRKGQAQRERPMVHRDLFGLHSADVTLVAATVKLRVAVKDFFPGAVAGNSDAVVAA